MCNPDSISWTSTELFGYFTLVGAHQLCEQSLCMALTYTYPILSTVFSWCRKQQLASLQMSVNLEVLGQERSAPFFKGRKELGTDWVRKRHRLEKLRINVNNSVPFSFFFFGFNTSIYHTLSCQIVTCFARFQASAAKLMITALFRVVTQ